METATIRQTVSVIGMRLQVDTPESSPEGHVADSDEYNAVTYPTLTVKKRRDFRRSIANTKSIDSTLSTIVMKDFAQTDLLKGLNNVDKIQNVQFQDVSGELKRIDIKENEEYANRNKLSSTKKIPVFPKTMKSTITTRLNVPADVPESTSLVKQTALEIDTLDDLPQKENDVQPIPIPYNLEKENVRSTSVDVCGTDPAQIEKKFHSKSMQKVKGTKKLIAKTSHTSNMTVRNLSVCSGDMNQIVHSGLSQQSSTTNNLESHPVDIEKKVYPAESSSQEFSKRKKLDNQSSSSQHVIRSTKNKKKINLRLKAKLNTKVPVKAKLLKINPVIGKDPTDGCTNPSLDKDRAALELCKVHSVADRITSRSPSPRQTVLDKSFPQEILLEDDLKNVKEVEFKVPPTQPKTVVSNLLNVSCGVLDAETIRRMNSSGSESDTYIPASPRKTSLPADMDTTPAVSNNKLDDLMRFEKVPVSNEGATNPRRRHIKQVKTVKQNQNDVAKKVSKRFKNRSKNQKQDYSVNDDLIKDSHSKSPERVLLPNETNVTKRRKLYSAKYDDPDLSMYQCPSEDEIPVLFLQGSKTKRVADSDTSRVVQTHSAASFSYHRSKDQPTRREIGISETFDSLKAMGPTYPHEPKSLHDQYTFSHFDSDTSVKRNMLPKTKSSTASKKQKKPVAKAKVDSKKIIKLPMTRKPKRELINEIKGDISNKTLKNTVGNNTPTHEVVDLHNNADLVKDDVPCKDVFMDLTEDEMPLGKKPNAKAKSDSKNIMKPPMIRKQKRELINETKCEIYSKSLNVVRNNTSLADEVVRCNPHINANLEKDDVLCKDIFVKINLNEDAIPLAKLSQFEMVHPDRPADISKVKKETTKQTENKKIAKSNKKITDNKSFVFLVPPTLDTSLPSLMVENLPILKYNDSFEGANIMERIVDNCPLMDISSNTLPLEFDKEEAKRTRLSQSSVLTLEDEPEMDGQNDSPADNLVLKDTPMIHNDVQLSQNEMSDNVTMTQQMQMPECRVNMSLRNACSNLPVMHSSQNTNSCQTDSTLHSTDIVMMTIDEEPILHQLEKEPKKIFRKLPIFEFDHRKYVNEVSLASSPDLIYCGSEIDLLQYKGDSQQDKPKAFEKSQGVSKEINNEASKRYKMSSVESTGNSSKSLLNPASNNGE